jgi:hypothetical protein
MQQSAVGGQVFNHEEEKIEPVPEYVLEHIKKHIVPASKTSSKCVDGGYQPNEATGELARPGADLGLCVILLSVGFTPQDAFDMVKAFRVSRGEKFGWHTDMHADPVDGSKHTEYADAPFCGCGHCVKAEEFAPLYGIETKGLVQELFSIVRKEYEVDQDQFLFVNLNRDHAEKAVLIIESNNFSVEPWDLETGTQFFIYDQTRDNELLKDLESYLREKFQQEQKEFNFPEGKLGELADKQTNATLGLLKTSRGATKYSVMIDNQTGAFTAKQIGIVNAIN